MSQQASPRGTFLKVADSVRALIEDNLEMTELPSLAEVMREHGVSRGVAIRDLRRKVARSHAVTGRGEPAS